MKSQEQIILENLVYNPEYTKKVIPFLKEEYFSDEVEKKVFVNIKQYVDQYNSPPTVNALNILLEGDKSLVGDTFENSVDYVGGLDDSCDEEMEWLMDQTENFCKDRAIFNAINESINIFKGDSGDKKQTAIPSILSDALAVSFDTHIGHDYIDDHEERFEFYKRK